MKNLGCFLLCIFLVKVQSSPQITKLFPLKELAAFHQQTNEIKPLDKFLGKLRATYNFVFNKPDDTSNVEKILAKDAPNPDIEALKLIWTNLMTSLPPSTKNDNKTNVDDKRAFDGSESKNTILSDEKDENFAEDDSKKIATVLTKDDWLDGIVAPDPLENLELQDDADDDGIIETTTPASTLQLPIAVGRQLLDWLGALLGLTYGAYNKVAQAIKC